MPSVTYRTLIDEAPLLLAVSTAVVIIAAITHFIVVPNYLNLVRFRSELTHYRSIISSESGYQLIKNEIAGKIDTLNAHLKPLPDQKKLANDPGSYLEMLITVARKADIRFIRMQPQEETRTDEMIRYPVLLVLSTTYHELGQFISAIEKLPFLFFIDRLAIDANSAGKCDVKLLVTCLIPKESSNE